MGVQFRDDIVSHVPTACLVEDYQALVQAVNEHDWDMVETVAQCIAEVIDRHTIVPEGLDIKPSPSSLVALACENGIIMSDYADIRCAAGKPVSFALSGGVCQCSEECMAAHACNPEECHIQLESGTTYAPSVQKSDEFVSELTARMRNKEEKPSGKQ